MSQLKYNPRRATGHKATASVQIQTPFSRQKESNGLKEFTTLKQACSSEYQGAQGAFKDSMIH
jgi:hypothetical protein